VQTVILEPIGVSKSNIRTSGDFILSVICCKMVPSIHCQLKT
jgi:hypothetical protein